MYWSPGDGSVARGGPQVYQNGRLTGRLPLKGTKIELLVTSEALSAFGSYAHQFTTSSVHQEECCARGAVTLMCDKNKAAVDSAARIKTLVLIIDA
jgi:ERCC4-related helicase